MNELKYAVAIPEIITNRRDNIKLIEDFYNSGEEVAEVMHDCKDSMSVRNYTSCLSTANRRLDNKVCVVRRGFRIFLKKKEEQNDHE